MGWEITMCEFEIKTDECRIRIPEGCFQCRWSSKPSIKQVKIRCKRKDAVVIKEDEGWLCYSYIGKVERNNIEYMIKRI